MEDLKSLLHNAQTGDPCAYDATVQRFQDMAVGYAYSIIGNFHSAEDAAQEAFIEAYSNLGKVYGPAACPGWLRKIIFKQCDRIMRRHQKEIVGLEAAIDLPSKTIGLDEAIVEKEIKDQVLTAIQALPENERVVTVLFYINEYSQTEIANFLEILTTTVNSRLRYARKRLKERMIMMVQDTLHQNRPSRDNQFVERVLQFPKDHSVGTLYVHDGIENTGLDLENWGELGKAQNSVKVESGRALALRIGREKKNDIAALAKLSPDDLQALEMGRIDQNNDFRFLTHLRDLRYVSVFNRGYNLDDEGLTKLIGTLPKL